MNFTASRRLPNRDATRDSVRAAALVLIAAGFLLAAEPTAHGAPSRLIQNLRHGQTQTVVAYGTSLTLPGPWPSQLASYLQGEFPGQVTLVNGGIPASSSTNAAPVFDLLGRLQERVLDRNPDTVLLEFAINDAYVPYNVSLGQSRTNLNTMIDRILADREDREVILMTMNPAWNLPGGLQPATDRPNLAAYYQIFRDVAAERTLLLIDHYANWTALRDANLPLFKSYIPDGIHPNAAGTSAVITLELIRALTVPEPAAWVLVAAALLTLGKVRRTQRNAPRERPRP